MKYKEIFNRLTKECAPAKVVAVSKTRSLEEVIDAYESGFRIFGENHVQEIVEKYSSWHPDDVQIHMIGHLQSNKVNKVVPLVDMIQSVDSLSLLEKINTCCEKTGKVMPVLLEVNTSEEDAKSGFVSEEDLHECVIKANNLKNISVKGFMTVGPLNHEKASEAFSKLRKIGEKYGFVELSMGMSQDYTYALKEGSTMVRIGTLIFGERTYTTK